MESGSQKKWTDDQMLEFARTYGCSSPGYMRNKLVEYAKSVQKYTEEEVSGRLEEAKVILKKLGVNEVYITKTSALTLLALCNVTPDIKWTSLTRTSMTMTKDIIKWCIENYNLPDVSNNRDQFRREGINVLFNHDLIDLNPDNQNLGPNSPLTHYAIKQKVLDKLKRIN